MILRTERRKWRAKERENEIERLTVTLRKGRRHKRMRIKQSHRAKVKLIPEPKKLVGIAELEYIGRRFVLLPSSFLTKFPSFPLGFLGTENGTGLRAQFQRKNLGFKGRNLSLSFLFG